MDVRTEGETFRHPCIVSTLATRDYVQHILSARERGDGVQVTVLRLPEIYVGRLKPFATDRDRTRRSLRRNVAVDEVAHSKPRYLDSSLGFLEIHSENAYGKVVRFFRERTRSRRNHLTVSTRWVLEKAYAENWPR